MNNNLPKPKVFYIDIRKSDEVYGKRFAETEKHVCIPSNMIRFNLQFLENLVKSHRDHKFYLVCYSGSRSKFIYTKYFANNNILKSVNVNELVQFSELGNLKYNWEEILGYYPILIYGGYNYYSLTRVLQTIMGSLLILTAVLLWSKCNKNRKWILWVALIMGINALINGLTSTCTISRVFMDYLN